MRVGFVNLGDCEYRYMEGSFEEALESLESGNVQEIYLHGSGGDLMYRTSQLVNAITGKQCLERFYLRGQWKLNAASLTYFLEGTSAKRFTVVDLLDAKMETFEAEKVANALNKSHVKHLFLDLTEKQLNSLTPLLKRPELVISTKENKWQNGYLLARPEKKQEEAKE